MREYSVATADDLKYIWNNFSPDDKALAERINLTFDEFVDRHLPANLITYGEDRCVFRCEPVHQFNVIYVWQFATWKCWRAKRHFRKTLLEVLKSLHLPVIAIHNQQHNSGYRWLQSLGFELVDQMGAENIWRRQQ